MSKWELEEAGQFISLTGFQILAILVFSNGFKMVRNLIRKTLKALLMNIRVKVSGELTNSVANTKYKG